MTVALVAVVAFAAGAAAGWAGSRWARERTPRGAGRVHRILLPFTGTAVSRRALDAALRLARAENATLMPAFLATVPKQLPLQAALPRQAGIGMPVLEAIEQIATRADVPVDARVARGRSYRHALQKLLEEERFDRVVVPATSNPNGGLSGDDLVWLLERAPAEVVILRPDPADRLKAHARASIPIRTWGIEPDAVRWSHRPTPSAQRHLDPLNPSRCPCAAAWRITWPLHHPHLRGGSVACSVCPRSPCCRPARSPRAPRQRA
jgi:nucleotide-binding universal stress UspA family protein